MGWTISVGNKGVSVAATSHPTPVRHSATPQWSFTPQAGAMPVWQAQHVCQQVLTALAGPF